MYPKESEYLIFFPPNPNTPRVLLGWGRLREFVCKEPEQISELENWIKQSKGEVFGYISYEAKYIFEPQQYLIPGKEDSQLMYFFEPENLWEFKKKKWCCLRGNARIETVEQFIADFNSNKQKIKNIEVQCEENEIEYQKKLQEIQENIQSGNYYETNFCIPFSGKGEVENGLAHFAFINSLTEAPHAIYFRNLSHEIWCTSPERYIQKIGKKLISQPIKGTIRRGLNDEEDRLLKQQLVESKKERSENIMIVDLVRNDLSRIAKKGSVRVDELCDCKTFKNLHHLVSTVSCEIEEKTTFTNILKATFPMGSMTGAPKISAVKHMEKLELKPRGIYSGSFGWIAPTGDFDFNVIIRSVVVSRTKKEISFHVGSAITRESASGNEFEECMLKARTTLSLFES
ncbi:MAG: chorismate-binding protein [Bacteroidota bacterium]